MKRTPIQRRTPLRAVGKRTLLRWRMNAKLTALGIDCCEVRLNETCSGRQYLTWAHSKKSRFLVTESDWMEAACCCLFCHMKIEAMSHEAMHRIVTEAIGRRDTL